MRTERRGRVGVVRADSQPSGEGWFRELSRGGEPELPGEGEGEGQTDKQTPHKDVWWTDMLELPCQSSK